jgi:hypothetical protein
LYTFLISLMQATIPTQAIPHWCDHFNNIWWMFMLILMGQDYVSELRPPMGLLIIPQIMYKYGEQQCPQTPTGLDTEARGKIFCLCWGSTPVPVC